MNPCLYRNFRRSSQKYSYSNDPEKRKRSQKMGWVVCCIPNDQTSKDSETERAAGDQGEVRDLKGLESEVFVHHRMAGSTTFLCGRKKSDRDHTILLLFDPNRFAGRIMCDRDCYSIFFFNKFYYLFANRRPIIFFIDIVNSPSILH